jgi:hypothetical protein
MSSVGGAHPPGHGGGPHAVDHHQRAPGTGPAATAAEGPPPKAGAGHVEPAATPRRGARAPKKVDIKV